MTHEGTRLKPWSHGIYLSVISVLICASTYSTAAVRSGEFHDITFERILADDGLSHGTINSIIQDRRGFLWLGTSTGLLRYDGYTFKRYSHDPSDSTSISGDYVWSLCEDSSGDLWIGTSGRGLDRYVRSANRFVHYRNIPDDSTSLLGDEVTSVYADAGNEIWAGSWNGGLNKFNRSTGNFTRYKDLSVLPSNNVSRLLEDRSGRFWVGTRRGLALFDRSTGGSRVYKPEPGNRNSLPGEYISAMVETRDGVVWFGTDGGICKYNPSSDDFSRIALPGLTNPVVALCEDNSGHLWVATDGGGLIRINFDGGDNRSFTTDPRNPDAISSNVILAMHRDREGVLWLGAVATGLSKYDPHRKKFRHVITDPGTVNALFEDSEGTVWIATQDGVKRMTRGSPHAESVAALGDGPVYALCEDGNGNMWFAKPESGLYRLNVKTGAVRALGLPGGPQDNTNKFLTSLFVDSHGYLWIGQSGGGISRYDPRTSVYEHHAMRTKPPFPSDYVWTIHEDRRGYLWCGTWGAGVVRFDPRTGESLVFEKTGARAGDNAISGNIVVAIAEDADGILWFGTWGDGLNRYDPVKNVFTHYSVANGLPNDQIYGILIDDRTDELWLTTGYGLARFNPTTGSCITYDESDGVQSLEFRRGAAHRGRSGMMYVGGVNGFNMFRPEEIRGNGSIPPVEFTSVRVFNREIALTPAPPDLSYDENFLSFEFAALDYAEPLKNRYAYMLEGFDSKWVDAGTRRYVSYTNLPPGQYAFHVKGSNNDGAWNDRGATFGFSISPPLWRTWWAYTAYLLVAVSIGIGWRRHEISTIRRKEREQAALREAGLQAELEQQKTRIHIARDLHDEVGSAFSSIAFFAQAIRGKSSDQETAADKYLALISESSSHAKEAMSDIIWSVNPVNDSLENVVSKFQRYASDLFESKGIAHTIEMPPINIPVTLDPERRRQLWLLFKEMVTNAAKHSRCTHVGIRLRLENSIVSLTISDDGTGFDPARPPSGHGLQNIRERAKIIGAALDLDSSPGAGTSWKVVFPV